PGEDEEFIVSAEVTDFEMNPIEISATPASMPIDDPDLGDMKDDIQTLVDAIEDLNTGVGDLDDGVSDLNDGAADLSTGSNSYLQGINELNQSSSELVAGSSEINDVLQQIANSNRPASLLRDLLKLTMYYSKSQMPCKLLPMKHLT